jgi:hypothetical protein
MKKYLVILATCTLFVSCQLYYENIATTKECTEWYLDEIYEAVKDGDVDDVREAMFDYYEWFDALDEAEEQVARDAWTIWCAEYEFKKNTISEYYKKHKDQLPEL